MTRVALPPVRAFRGEHRLLPDEVLPDVLSPSAENCDYSRGTIQKRKGFVRIHDEAMKEGSSANIIQWHATTAHDNTGDFTVEVHYLFGNLPTSDTTILQKGAGSTSGWRMHWDAANGRVEFKMADSGGTTRTALPNASTTWETGRIYHIVARRNGTSLTMVVDGVGGSAVTCSGETVLVANMVGNSKGASDLAILDEVRIWSDRRTVAELDPTTGRELTDEELADATLIGYWKINDGTWFITDDSSSNNHHGSFFSTTPSYVSGLVPNESSDSFAMRMDGLATSIDAPYHADYAPILNTGDTWTIEAWIRYDSDVADGNERILQLGDADNGNGSPFDIYIDSSRNLFYNHSTTTTDNNSSHDTTYNVVVGTAFHLALVRDGTSIFTYIDGVLQDTQTGIAAENGPTTETDHGMKFGHQEATGNTNLGAVTLDDVRLWITARSSSEINDWYRNTYIDTKDSNLVGYWRFNSQGVKVDETARSDLSYSFASGTALYWSRGLVYPSSPRPILMCAPYSQPIEADEVFAGRNPIRRQLLCATHSNYWALQNDEAREIKRFVTDDPADQRSTGDTSKFDWAHFRTRLIACNGQEPNQLYGGDEVPHMLTFRAPTAAPGGSVSAGSGTFPSTGTYTYIYSYLNSKNSIESPVSAEFDIVVDPTTEEVGLTGLDLDPPLGATHSRVYRKDVGTTNFRFLTDVARGTSTFTDTGVSITANDAQANVTKVHLEPYRRVAVFANRLWLANTAANPSGLAFSEAGSESFLLASTILVDRGDGDEITGLLSAFGRLLVFKQFSIHELQGNTASTFVVRKTVAGQGCISGLTLAESPRGIYYLSHDGVYLYNGQEPIYVSATQQTEFAKIDADKRREAVAAYDPETHQYVISLDFTDGRRTMVYDEETDSWAKWTVPFDYLVSAEHSSAQRELLGARNGYIHRLFEGTTDGSAVGSTESATLSGSLSGNSTAVITDGTATFPTAGDGLAGVPLLTVNTADSAEQERLIIGNTATVLNLDRALSPAVTGTYYIAPVNFFYETRFMDLGTTNVKRIWRTLLWVKENSSTVTLKWKTETHETFQSQTFSTADEFIQLITDSRGRRLKLRFENLTPAEAVEIESFQVEYSPRKRN